MDEDIAYEATCAWFDFREDYGVSDDDHVRERGHRAFLAGFEAARRNADRGNGAPSRPSKEGSGHE